MVNSAIFSSLRRYGLQYKIILTILYTYLGNKVFLQLSNSAYISFLSVLCRQVTFKLLLLCSKDKYITSLFKGQVILLNHFADILSQWLILFFSLIYKIDSFVEFRFRQTKYCEERLYNLLCYCNLQNVWIVCFDRREGGVSCMYSNRCVYVKRGLSLLEQQAH